MTSLCDTKDENDSPSTYKFTLMNVWGRDFISYFLLYLCSDCHKTFWRKFSRIFRNMGKSLYSLFQIMTLESWSNGIIRPILKLYPCAWIVFVSFILIVSFVVLNMAIEIVVDSITRFEIKNE